MSERFQPEQIRQFWTDQAVAHGGSPDASWSDRPVIEMEVGNLTRYLSDGDLVLDAGCANGWSTIEYAQQHHGVRVHGIDYIPQMIDIARNRLKELNASVAERLRFDVADITDLPMADQTYDKVVVTRVLINLMTWPMQAQSLNHCLRVLKKGGLLLLSEATLQGWQSLNAFRAEWGLEPIPMPPFNQYLDENQVIEAARPQAELVEVNNFASTYYVGTRVFKPLLDAALGGRVNVADPLMHFNRFFAQLPPAGEYGTQKLFVFRKR